MNRAEKEFLSRGEAIAKKLEAKAGAIRFYLAQTYLMATERSSHIMAECDGIATGSWVALIEQAVVADKAREDE